MPVRFAKVDKNLYRGGAPSPNDISLLKDKYGIKKIVSLDENVAKRIAPIVERLGLEHIIFPLTDGNGPNVDELPDEVRQWATDGPTYVHCLHGKDRTSMACAMYRILMNGWDKDEAIVEAYKFGMGQGLSPSVRNSYYNAVRKMIPDENNLDVVTLQRDNLAKEQHPPAINDQTKPYQNKSFAPYLDVEQNHLFYSGGNKLNNLIKLASNDPLALLEELREQSIKKQAGIQIFKYGPTSKVLLPNRLWSTSMMGAREQAENMTEDDVMYIATISDNANVQEFPHEATQTLVHDAMMGEADAAVFTGGEVFIINPKALVDIKQLGKEDTNDIAPVVGLFDNYVGFSQHSFPGTSGFMGGAGTAGIVETNNSFQL